MTTTTDRPAGAPSSDIDLYADEQLLDPYAAYAQLRETGGAVWLPRLDMYIVTRYADVKRSLADWQTFTSGSGVMMNEPMNHVLRGNTLCSDGDAHDAVRSIIARPLTPKALRPLRADIEAQADALVERLVAQGSFDAATDLAQYLPVNVVSNLVGLPEEGRERMLAWAAAVFDAIGPENERGQAALPLLQELMGYAGNPALRDSIKPGSWAEAIYAAMDEGKVTPEQCPVMLVDYVAPSLDTTIFAIGNAVELFARHPDQWDLVRADPKLVPSALNEVLRLESPIQGWSRLLERDAEIDGVELKAGDRTLLMWAAANRDPREFPDPDRFDVRRNPIGHLGFGHGPHACVGMNLAKIEIHAVLTALASRVERFEVHSSTRALNNILRGFSSLQVSVH